MQIDREKYKQYLKVKKDYKKISINTLIAFACGGLVCVFGQLLLYIFRKIDLDSNTSKSLMSITVVIIASLLSAFGIYDKIGQIAKAGSVVPISGFANSLVSASMEYKSEGFLLGLSANVFKLAGSIIVLGVFFGYIVGFLKYLWSLI